ncbi:MAG: hypothetical protein ACRDPC_27465 [Solirubrobacteraceae bacterium]
MRTEIPSDCYWEDTDAVRGMLHTSLLIDLHPEAQVQGAHARWEECTTAGDLPGYSFGWWPLSDYGLTELRDRWPEAPAPQDWTFLAICSSRDELGLRFSDMGDLCAVTPTAELAVGDFTHLHCDGESS